MTDRIGNIYTLTDPRNGLIRYVGATVATLSVRLSSHINGARSGSGQTPTAAWIRDLLALDLRPIQTLIGQTPEPLLRKAEYAQIHAHNMAGWPLLNVDGMPGRFGADHELLPALHARIERCRAAGEISMLADAERELRILQESVGVVLARGIRARAVRNRLYPENSIDWPSAIAAHVARWDRRPAFHDYEPLNPDERERLSNAILAMAVAARRHGVPFEHVIDGMGSRVYSLIRPERNHMLSAAYEIFGDANLDMNAA